MEVIFLREAAKSFLRAWQSQLLASSENRHADKPIKELNTPL